MLRYAGFTLSPVPAVDAEGMQPDALEGAAATAPGVIITPRAAHNPTAVALASPAPGDTRYPRPLSAGSGDY